MTDHKTVREALRLAEKKCFDATGRIDLELSSSITQAFAALDRIEAPTQPHGYDDNYKTNATSGTNALPCETCKGNADSCADVPSLRHCEAANRESPQADAQRQAALDAYDNLPISIGKHAQEAACQFINTHGETIKAALQSPAVQQQQPTNARRQEALDAFQKWLTFARYGDCGFSDPLTRVTTLVDNADTIVTALQSTAVPMEVVDAFRKTIHELERLEYAFRMYLPDIDDPSPRGEEIRKRVNVAHVKTMQLRCADAVKQADEATKALALLGGKEG